MRRFHPFLLLSAIVAASAPSGSTAIDVRYLPLFALGMGAIIYIPYLALIGRSSGWRRLAESYPNHNARHARSFRSGPAVMNRSVFRGGVRFTPGDAHLHFAMSGLARPGHRPFSVPWSDIAASHDEWPWFPFKGHSMVRLTLAADPGLRILVKARDGRRIVDESGGRLTLHGPGEAGAAALR